MNKFNKAYFRLAKKEVRAAKAAGDQKAVDRIMDEAFAGVDEMIAAMPLDPPYRDIFGRRR